MRNRLVRKCLPIFCLLATSLYANLVLADWYSEPSQNYYNQKFGSFPPLDIDQQLDESMKTDNQSEQRQSWNISDTNSDSSNQPDSHPKQEYSAQKPQQTNYLNNDQGRSVSSRSDSDCPQKKRRSSTKKKRRSGFSAPWDNSGSSFSGPWNNKGSGFSAPWDDNGSSFSFPWNNKGSGFSTPWDSNGSGFNAPWNNRGSSFGPWGNRNRR